METCLFIHGFTGGEYEISPLAQFLERSGYVSRMFTLHGHGGGRRELLDSSRRDWQLSAEEEPEAAILKLRQSTSDRLLYRSADCIAAIRSVCFQDSVAHLVVNPGVSAQPGRDSAHTGPPGDAPNYLSKWGSTPMRATREFQRLVRESFEVYPQAKVPTLIVQGRRDHLVKFKSADYLRQTIPSERRQVLIMEQSGHMVCHSAESPAMMDEVLRFIRRAGDSG